MGVIRNRHLGLRRRCQAFNGHSRCKLTRVLSGTGQCVDSGRDQAHTQLTLGR